MKKQTVFVKRYPSNGDVPKVSRRYFTNYGYSDYSVKTKQWCDEDWLELDVEWFLEEIELPKNDEIFRNSLSIQFDVSNVDCYLLGANFILNKLK